MTLTPEVVTHVAIPLAIQLASNDLGCQMEMEWIPTNSLENGFEQKLASFQGLWTVPASPYKSMQGALNGIRFAREHNVPFLGTCGGFQHMIIEFARNVLELSEADHAEENPTSSLMLVAPLTCSVSEKTHTFKLTPGSKTADIYGDVEIVEQYGICNYGLNHEFAPLLENAGMRIAGVDTDGETRIMELINHPFFIGTLFQPERSAFKNNVHPLIKAFLQKVIQ
ncbi:CTP synthase C-terminal region-related (seleno)protein [Paenibacillus glycanilyticus]|uniref:CTP synthase C-terminal region-related (seleno)protein n=1 Tax=Paenibacillus glycanilyticus TaxID=126569 RepID=UPI001F2C653B|nr:gamma-glutamyl-gamma-aminobutyrate hydrolase family protein [Paenibacillus glycanilyticus]